MMWDDLFQALSRNWSLIQLVIDAVENKGVSSEEVVAAVKQLLLEASDAQMKAELPEGS